MATSRAFTLNATGEPLIAGEPISGTTQYGLIAVQNLGASVDFVGSGLKWYNGPDEDANPAFNFANAGYVVCTIGTTSSPDGTTSPIKFFRSADKSESAFIALATAVTGRAYTNGNDAAADLLTSGIASTWETTQTEVTYNAISVRSSACSTTYFLYFGSDNKYYSNQSGSLFTGTIYTAPMALGNNQWSWNVTQIWDGVPGNNAQEQSSCGPGDGEQFISPN